MRRTPRPEESLQTYLRLLTTDARDDQFLEIRWTVGAGLMGRRFFRAGATSAAARRISQLASARDVYVGVALRDSDSAGGKDVISGSRFVFVEIDRPECAALAARFAHPPSIEIASGRPRHRHLYWRLTQLASNEQVESANRRLAAALNGDPASVDVARILRPPSTINHRHGLARPVTLLIARLNACYCLTDLTRALPADPRPVDTRAPVNKRSRRVARTQTDRELLAIPAREYVRVLAGASPNRAGKIHCPFHDDSEPSLQLYDDGTFCCFGSDCARAGSIYDFAAATWGMGTRGSDFRELRRRLASSFGLSRRP
jgi:hypothetical protein